MTNSGQKYVGVILDEIREQNKAVLEVVGEMKDRMETLATKEELKVVADDVKVIKAAVTDICHQQLDHEKRLTRLEAARV